MIRKYFTPEIITVEQAEAIIEFCASHETEVTYSHKNGVITCETVRNMYIKDGVTKL